MLKRLRTFGPGLLVTAAFIGPGTVTTASVAGAEFGFVLLWALVFSIIATIVLQEMSARLGLVTGQGLGEAIRTSFRRPAVRVVSILLVVAAIAFGNAAFQAGNIMGAAAGLEILTSVPRPTWVLTVAIAACALLAAGRYAIIERALMILVGVMSAVFILTAIMVRPDVGDMLSGLFQPRIPEGSLTTIIALIGTTVVPYNLFLHASSVRRKWSEDVPLDQALGESRIDTGVSIALGGLVTLAIMATAAGVFVVGTKIDNAAMMAQQLEPLLGAAAGAFFAAGLFAAGLTSAITAPLAAAYAMSGVLGWGKDMRDWKFRTVWFVILIAGASYAYVGKKPIDAITFAQAANGLLLPIIAVFLLIVVNRADLLKEYRNRIATNVAGMGVIAVTAGLGAFKIWQVWQKLRPHE